MLKPKIDGKISYTPPQSKRFDISKDAYSQRRLEVIRSAFAELKKVLPSIGISLFGSLSKGKELTAETHAKSDIDVDIIVEASELKLRLKECAAAMPNFERVMKEQIPIIEKKQLKKRDVWRWNADEIQCAAAEEALKKGVRDMLVDMLDDVEPTAGQLSININVVAAVDMEKMRHTLASCDPHPDFENSFESAAAFDDATRTAVAFFHLDVGGGLKKYRQEFLEKLGTLPQERRDWVWNDIADQIKDFERQNRISKDLQKQFPSTYEDAVNYYGIKKPPQ